MLGVELMGRVHYIYFFQIPLAGLNKMYFLSAVQTKYLCRYLCAYTIKSLFIELGGSRNFYVSKIQNMKYVQHCYENMKTALLCVHAQLEHDFKYVVCCCCINVIFTQPKMSLEAFARV